MQHSVAGGYGGEGRVRPGRATEPTSGSPAPLTTHLLSKALHKDPGRTPAGRCLEPDAWPRGQGCVTPEGRRGHRGTHLPQGCRVEGSEAGFPRLVPGLTSHLLRNRIPSHRWSAASPRAPEPWAPAACQGRGRRRREGAAGGVSRPKGKVVGRGPRCSGAPPGHCRWDLGNGEAPHPAWALQAAGGARRPQSYRPGSPLEGHQTAGLAQLPGAGLYG